MTLSVSAEFFISCLKSSEPPWIISLLPDFVGKKNKRSVLSVMSVEIFQNLDEEQLKLILA